MSKSVVVTARVSEETLAMIDRAAAFEGRSRAAWMADAVRRFAEHDAEFIAFVQEGIDSADRGELTPHEEVFREIRARRKSLTAHAAE